MFRLVLVSSLLTTYFQNKNILEELVDVSWLDLLKCYNDLPLNEHCYPVILLVSIYSAVPFCLIACLQWSCFFLYNLRFFFSAAFAFPMIRFDGMFGSAVAIVSVDSSRLVLFVVSSISAYIKLIFP